MIRESHATIKKVAHITGLNKVKFLQRVHDKIIRIPLPFPVTVQGVKMPHVLFRIYLKGSHELATTNLVKQVVKPGQIVVDLGAQFGYYTLLLAKLVGQTGKVYSFEPFDESFNNLQDGIRANKFKNIIAVKKAVSNKTGEKKFYVSSYSHGRNTFNENIPHDSFTLIPSITLDEFFKEKGKVDFIKIDIEGEELNALEGARSVLANNPDIKLTIELAPKTLQSMKIKPESFLSSIRSYGLAPHFIEEDGSTKAVSDEELIHEATRKGHINLYCSKG